MMTRRFSMSMTALCALFVSTAGALPARTEEAAQVSITYADRRFEPAEATAPADRPIVLHVRNSAAKAIEFESKTLHVEKVIAAGTEGLINLRPLKPGRYEYFNDLDHEARGALVVE